MKLKDIKDPSFLKSLSVSECEELAAEIRTFLIENVAKTGGHLSSNLGVVELTIALHKMFDSPQDRIIFDVGHQGYVHKILTGRAGDFSRLRKIDGLSGFLKRDESVHDVFEAGHSSTSLAAQAGMLFAKTHNEDINHVIAVIGDGALASGMALESLNFLGQHPELNPLIILNDNEMSISENVGHLARMMTRLRMKRSYRSFRRRTAKLVPGRFRKLTTKIEKRVRGFLTGTTYFESLGYRYFGPLDGHDIKGLCKAFEVVKRNPSPTVLHVRTKKGKGYPPAEKDTRGLWHGVPPFDIESGVFKKAVQDDTRSYSEIVARYLERHAEKNEPFYVLTPAMTEGSALTDFREKFPGQFIDTGIAEATAVTLACSLALSGVKPFLSIYSTFLQRAYDQILHDAARQKAPVIFGVDRSGIVGGDGETHQGIYDIPMLAHIPHVTIAHPRNPKELVGILNHAFTQAEGPFFVRYPKMTPRFTQDVLADDRSIPPSWEEVLPGEDATVIAFGEMVNELEKRIMASGLSIRLIDARYLKPLDEEILKSIDREKPLVVHEESTLSGGLGERILSHLAHHGRMPASFRAMGFQDTFVGPGSRKEILVRLDLDADSVIATVKRMRDAS